MKILERIAHIADTHLGYYATRHVNAFGVNVREDDGERAFVKMIDEIIAAGCIAVVMAGDTFHVARPSVRTIMFLRTQLWRLWEASIKVYALGGNHEITDTQIDMSSAALLHDPWRGLYSHVEPYVAHEIIDGVFLHLVSHHMYGQQFDTMKQVKPVPGAINIFTTHGSVIDPILKIKLHTEQSPREIVIPDGMLNDNDWSYTWLGHIHERGWVGSKDGLTDTHNSRIYYNGSLIRRGFSDAETRLGRGWTLWEIGTDGTFTATPQEIAQRPQIDFEPIDAMGITASEISDIMISNLRATQTDGNKFDLATAPILRQRLVNIDAAKQAALDWKGISENNKHALDWKTQRITTVTKEHITDEDEEIATVALGSLTSSDILESYTKWHPDSQMLKNIEEDDIRDKVISQAQSFIKLGQEKTIERE